MGREKTNSATSAPRYRIGSFDFYSLIVGWLGVVIGAIAVMLYCFVRASPSNWINSVCLGLALLSFNYVVLWYKLFRLERGLTRRVEFWMVALWVFALGLFAVLCGLVPAEHHEGLRKRVSPGLGYPIMLISGLLLYWGSRVNTVPITSAVLRFGRFSLFLGWLYLLTMLGSIVLTWMALSRVGSRILHDRWMANAAVDGFTAMALIAAWASIQMLSWEVSSMKEAPSNESGRF